jgi:hypothetical protein
LNAAVHPSELLAVQFELDEHGVAGRPGPGVAERDDAGERGVLEDTGVEVCRFFGLVIEPEKGGECSHVGKTPPALGTHR